MKKLLQKMVLKLRNFFVDKERDFWNTKQLIAELTNEQKYKADKNIDKEFSRLK